MISEIYLDLLRDAVERLFNVLHAMDCDGAAGTGQFTVRCEPTDCFLNLVAALRAIKFDRGIFEHGSGLQGGAARQLAFHLSASALEGSRAEMGRSDLESLRPIFPTLSWLNLMLSPQTASFPPQKSFSGMPDKPRFLLSEVSGT
jgi:hypothetical protein